MDNASNAAPTKGELIAALRTFVSQRPGMEPSNYGSLTDYHREARRITAQRDDALALLAAVDARESITADDMLAQLRHRLLWDADRGSLEYQTGQYFPTEYRRAAASAMAGVLWQYWHDVAALAGSADIAGDIRRYARLAFRGRRLLAYFR